jgi:hypothetical protein
VITRTLWVSLAAAGGALALILFAVGPTYGREGSNEMVMTVLEAHVAPDRWDALRQSYETRARSLPPQIVESFLVQGTNDSSVWRILTVWRSRGALEEVRQSGVTPTGVLIFRDAGAEPGLTIFTVWANPRSSSGPAR